MPPKKDNKMAGKLLNDMAHDSKIRTTEKSRRVVNDYETELDQLQDEIDENVAEKNKALSTIRREQLTRLLTVMHKRSEIETAIADSHTRVTQSYETASRELRRTMKGQAAILTERVAGASLDFGGVEDGEGEKDGDGEGSSEDKENEAPRPVEMTNVGIRLKRRTSGYTNGAAATGQDRTQGIQK